MVVEALVARGFDADGEVGELSVIGSVARAVERTRYDAIVVPVPAVGVLDTIDLEVAHRLHQIDVPLVIVPPWRRQQPVVRPGNAPAGLVVGFLLIGVLALLVGVLIQTEHPVPGYQRVRRLDRLAARPPVLPDRVPQPAGRPR
jgi:hypothetical protein